MRIKVVFCEGVHDIAYIDKIMKVHGYEDYIKDDPNEYPYPINKIIITNAQKVCIFKGKDSRVPFCALYKDDDLILFHKMDGDGKVECIKGLISQYVECKEALNFENPDDVRSIDYYIFYDADTIGVNARLDAIRNAFCDEFGIPKEGISQGEVCQGENANIGVYIFHDPDDDEKKGVLEDQLLKLMKNSNETIFANASSYLEDNQLPTDRRLKYNPLEDKMIGKDNNYKYKKSLIGIAGQLQFSGVDNTTIIEYSDYIKKDDILSSTECNIIHKLLS